MPSFNWNLPEDRVKCSAGGKHDVQTYENKNDKRGHVKFTACRKCHHVINIIKY